MVSATSSQLSWQQNPLRELVRLAWPITVSMLSISCMTAVDTLFVGHLGAAALAGVALGATATFTVFCFGAGVMRGTKIAVAQAVGAGREHAVQAQLGASLCAAAALGLASIVIGEAIAWGLPLLTASADSGAAARAYAAVRMLAAPLFIGTAALREVRHGLGDSRSPMLSVLIGNVVNALLVAVFMYGFGWGVAGVAFATVLAQLVELGVMVWLQRARGFGLSEFSRQDLHTVLRLGLPLAIERVLDVGSFSVVVALFARMGDTDLAAHQVAHQVFLFAFLPLFAVGDATCVLVGQALGAGCLSALPPVQRAGSLVSYIYVAACSSGVVLFGPELAGAFTHDAAVIARATELQQIGALFLWLMPLYIVAQATLRGMGDVRVAAIITVIAAWICAPIFSAAFGIGLGLGAAGGWIGIGVEFGLASACFRWRQRRLLRSQAENAAEVLRPSQPALA